MRVLVVLGISVVTYSISQNAAIPAIGQIAGRYDVPLADASWMLTAYFLAAAVLTPVFGRLGDLFGSRRMLVLALVLYGVGNLMSAVADTFTLAVLGRAVQGAGGGVFPLFFGLLRELLPASRVPSGIGFVAGISGVGVAAGLVVGGVVIDHL